MIILARKPGSHTWLFSGVRYLSLFDVSWYAFVPFFLLHIISIFFFMCMKFSWDLIFLNFTDFSLFYLQKLNPVKTNSSWKIMFVKINSFYIILHFWIATKLFANCVTKTTYSIVFIIITVVQLEFCCLWVNQLCKDKGTAAVSSGILSCGHKWFRQISVQWSSSFAAFVYSSFLTHSVNTQV